jgi:hypothetical protein
MRKAIAVLALSLALCLVASTAFAKAGGKANKAVKGKILSVSGDGSSIVVETKGHKTKAGKEAAAEQVTVAINDATTIEINDVGGKHASDLRPTMKVKVSMTSGAATDIKATDHAAPHHKKKGAAAVPKKAA